MVLIAITKYASAEYISDTRIMLPDYGSTTPAKGEMRIDPTTGLEVTRISDKNELTPASVYGLIVYSRYSPTNTTDEYVLVHHANSTSASLYRISDKVNLGTIRKNGATSIGEVNEIRWDYTGNFPNRIYFVDGMKFYQMDVINSNGNPTLIRDFSADFPGASKIINDVEGDSSNDSRYWAWQVLGPYDGSKYPVNAIFTYDKQQNNIIGILTPQQFGRSVLPSPNMVEISPLGTRVITHYGDATSNPSVLSGVWTDIGNNVWEFSGYKSKTSGNNAFGKVTANGTVLQKKSGSTGAPENITGDNQYANNSSSDKFWIRLTTGADPNSMTIIADWGIRPDDINTDFDAPRAWNLDFSGENVVISASETHSGWAWDLDGNEMFVSQNNKQDWIEARNIITGTITQVIRHGNGASDLSYANGFHFAKIYNRNYRGWMIFNTSSKTNLTWGENQILAMEIKPSAANPRIWRIFPRYNAYNGAYRDEGQVALSHSGLSLWHTGNWGVVSGSGDSYMIQMPTTWYQDLNPGDTTSPGAPTFLVVE